MDAIKRTKVLATLGPASASEEVLTLMANAGLDAVRVNTSHLEPDAVGKYVELVRGLEGKIGKRLAIVFDLQGPKIRLDGVPAGGVEVATGQTVTIAASRQPSGSVVEPSIDPAVLTTDYASLPAELSQGEVLLIGDGEVKLLVADTLEGLVRTEVLEGGLIKPRKGVTRPGRSFAADSLQDRDFEFIKAGCELAVDWFAVSFVRRGADMDMARGAVRGCGGHIPLIAKIEQPEAVDNLDEVLEASDAVMVARGDLGLFLPVEQVPMIQKRIIARCNEFALPVITATQMLESMIKNDYPTRAEVSDVANAILDGTDAVMLSEETATGAFPVDVVEMMSRIARATEPSAGGNEDRLAARPPGLDHIAEQVALAACRIARKLSAKAIIAPTASGFSAKNVARFRPGCPIIATTNSLPVARRLALSFGVRPVLTETLLDPDRPLWEQVRGLPELPACEPGDYLVFLGGIPAGRSGITNFVKVEQAGV